MKAVYVGLVLIDELKDSLHESTHGIIRDFLVGGEYLHPVLGQPVFEETSLGRIPEEGAQLKYENITLTVTEMKGVKIEKVLIIKE